MKKYFNDVIQKAAHDLVNTEFFPECIYRLGHTEIYSHRDATISIKRTGNLHEHGHDALTYSYRVQGADFDCRVRSVYANEDQATAEVFVLSISPDTDAAHNATVAWLLGKSLDS